MLSEPGASVRCRAICSRPGLCSPPTCSQRCCHVWARQHRIKKESYKYPTSHGPPLNWSAWPEITPGHDITPDDHCTLRSNAELVGKHKSLPNLSASIELLAPLRAAFVFIVRDGATFIERNVRSLAVFRKVFREVRLYYAENDSVDSTRSILRKLERELSTRNVQMSGVMITHSAAQSAVDSYALCAPKVAQMNCRLRRRLLASLRQTVLEMALAWRQSDLIVVVDVDFTRFPAEDFVRAAGLGVVWNASAVFGLSTIANRTAWWGKVPMAFPNIIYDVASILPRKTMDALYDMCIANVESGYGGVGIYSGSILRRAQPMYSEGQRTEHDAFHAALRQGHKGSLTLLIDPRFRPEFEFGTAAFRERVERSRYNRGPTSTVSTYRFDRNHSVPQARQR